MSESLLQMVFICFMMVENSIVRGKYQTMHTIKNEYLTVRIHEKGATLWSIRDLDNNEYLWQGDINYWEDRAPNLFPYIARMTEGKYILEGRTYEMDIHGFAKDTVFVAEQIAHDHIVFSISNTEETYKQYPYQFQFSVIYRLEKKKIHITYYVKNNDNRVMYFGIGGHPGFNVPYERNTVFEDYYLEFDEITDVKRVGFSEDCFVTEELNPFSLENGKCLLLQHGLFDNERCDCLNRYGALCYFEI